MKLKLTYERAGGSAVDLVATLDSQATIGDLAEYLLAADPERRTAPGDAHTLCLLDGQQMLDRDLPITDSPVGSGVRVGVLPASARYHDRRDRGGAAILSVSRGPDGPREFELPLGSSVVGRGADCEVQLNDPMVSRRHVRLSITDIIEVHDLGSANGVLVGSQSVSRTTLRPSDLVEVGDTIFSIRLVHRPTLSGPADVGASVPFVRSPTIAPRFEGRKFQAPQPPERQRKQRFPLITLMAPVALALVLYQFTHQVLSLLFMALSPLMLVGGVLESRRASKAEFREAVGAYSEDLDKLRVVLDQELNEERRVRLQEAPDSASLLVAARTRATALWSRRPGDDDFLVVRLGLATLPSRCEVDVPSPGRAPFELYERVLDLAVRYATVSDVPVTASLRASAVGVAGPRRAALRSAQSVLAQTVALHSSAELIVAALCSGETAPDWDWLKWLPHTTSPQSPISSRHLVTTPTSGGELVTQLEDLLAARDEGFTASAEDPAVLVLIEVDPPVEHNRLVALAEHGPSRGVSVLWLATDQALLPAACRAFVTVAADSASSTVGLVADRAQLSPVELDIVERASVVELARNLAPVIDLGAKVLDASDIPRSVSQLSMLGTELGKASTAILERWQESASIITGPFAPAELPKRAANLRAVLGQSSSGPHTIDLRTDGPHALVGGTTGAGKSELLQSWVLALASAHSPQRVNFLFVDYKGGAAFAECESLPHSIGVVTDLRPHLVRRALESLKAELRYRERLLASHRAKDLVQLERMGVADAPPSLIIVVDEFAALVKEVPEFVDGVVDVAQRGRSLGLHLILATQRPAGVIKDNLRANTNLRIALRMADADDSSDVLGTPDAAFFDPALPGRAMSKSGPKSLVPFQASYSGGWTADEPDAPEILVEELTLREAMVWEPAVSAVEVAKDEDATDIRRLVRQIVGASAHARLPAPRKAWQPDLAPVIDVVDLDLRETDEALAFARGDDPGSQSQPTVFFNPDREGNMIVYGTSGTGKSTALRTIAIAAGYAAVSTPTHVYGLDFGSRGLSSLQVLPHVGDVIPGGDHERLARLLTTLRATIDDRAGRFAGAGATSLTQFRTNTGSRDPRILLLLDGLPPFRAAYEVGDRQRWVDLLVSIMSDGRPVGVHVILSSDQRNGLTSQMGSSVQRRVVLRMAAVDDYSMLGVPPDVLDAAATPGRGLDGRQEIQVAVLGSSGDASVQADRMRRFAQKMTEAGVGVAAPVESLPEVLSVPDSAVRPELVALGMAGETLSYHYVKPSGGFLLTGPSGSGRSSALATLVEQGQRGLPGLRWHYLGQKRSPLSALGLWESRCTSADEVTAWADGLTSQLKAYAESGARAGLVIESGGDYVGSMAESALQALVRQALADGHWVIVESEASTVNSGIGYIGLIKASRTGLALQPDMDMSALFRTPFPRVTRAEFPPGRGLFVTGGRTTLVQVAAPPDTRLGAG